MYMVYWTDTYGESYSKSFLEISTALNLTQSLRNEGHKFVCMASEIKECVTKLGVDSVSNGILPNGNNYDWKKRR